MNIKYSITLALVAGIKAVKISMTPDDFNYEDCDGSDDCYTHKQLMDFMDFPIPFIPDHTLDYKEPENILMQTVWPVDYFAPQTIVEVGDLVSQAFAVNAYADSDVGEQIESTLDSAIAAMVIANQHRDMAW